MLQFDRFRYDRANQRLKDASGTTIRLNPKAFEVLTVLLERRGELVLKDDLLDAVWGDTHVADGVLKVCVAELRKALGDSVAKPRFIETVHRRGYRFVAPVTGGDARAGSSPPRGSPAAAPREASSAPRAAGVAVPREAASPPRAEDVATPRDLSSAPRAERVAAPRSGSVLAWPAGGLTAAHVGAGLVGRGGEIDGLEERLGCALRGERQVVFVTGEAGAGKTALVESFLAGVARRETVAITGSQCLEHFGSAEAYMPVLEAIGRLVREDAAARPLLRRYAPTWFAQLPWLIEEDDRDRLSRELLGAARDRMLREMAEFAEAYSADMPLVLVLDDLHWSDPSTVDLLSLLAGRREPARLLVLATYRPAELVLAQHPLRAVSQKLATNRQSTEVALDDLPLAAVADYLDRRFAGSRFPAELAKLVRERTDGNPLFLVTLLDHLLARRAIVERDGQWQAAHNLRDELAAVPESLRRLIEQQVDRLGTQDRRLLEAASLVGIEFSTAAAAGGAGRDTAEAEERFEQLATGGQLLRRARATAWPDGTMTGRFAFRHALYRDALAAAVPPRRRIQLHGQIATVLERAHGERSAELAAELALHFEEGRDRARAVHYRRLAAQTAAGRHAFTEAETHLEKALALLDGLAASPERDQEELALQSMIGPVRMATRGFAAPEVAKAYTRALELSSGAAQDPAAFPMLWGLWVFYAVRGDLDRALELAERNRTIAEDSGERLLRLEAHHALWTTHVFRGEFTAALHHLDQGEPLYDPVADRWSALVYGNDPKMAALGYRALVMWAMGRIDHALELSQQGVEHARALGHPMSVGQAMVFAAWIHLCRREVEPARELAEAVTAYCTEHAIPFWMPNGLQIRAWALVEQGDIEEGLAEWERGAELWNTMRGSLGRTAYDALRAAAYGKAGRFREAREVLDGCRALVTASGERYHESEIDRIDAELLLAETGGAKSARAETQDRAETLLDTAIACAREQSARTFELRAATALARLNDRGAKGTHARTRLAELLSGITEGLDTADVEETRRVARC